MKKRLQIRSSRNLWDKKTVELAEVNGKIMRVYETMKVVNRDVTELKKAKITIYFNELKELKTSIEKLKITIAISMFMMASSWVILLYIAFY